MERAREIQEKYKSAQAKCDVTAAKVKKAPEKQAVLGCSGALAGYDVSQELDAANNEYDAIKAQFRASVEAVQQR